MGIFICYGRRDATDFVAWLQQRLIASDREVWVDWTSLIGGTVWLDEIHQAIEAADTFVFVLTAGSLDSPYCRDELSHAVTHGKRILWIRRQPVADERIPDVLRRLHWTSFLPDEDPEPALAALQRALDHDLAWERPKAALLARARAWQLADHDSFLLQDQELEAALRWQAEVGLKPERTLGTVLPSYLEASRRAVERERVRWRDLHAKALGRELATRAELVRQSGADQLERSVLLAAEALRRSPSLEADQALRSGIRLLPRALLRQPYVRPVEVVRFSPDGRYLAAGGRDGVAQVCRVPDGTSARSLAHGGEVRGLAFSADGQRLATAGSDGTAVVWTLPDGVARLRLVSGYSLSGVFFNRDADVLATTSWDGTVVVWDAGTGRELHRFRHDAPALHAQFSPSGHHLATASQDGTARVWALASGQEQFRREAGPDRSRKPASVRQVAFSPDGTALAIACGDGLALVCDAATGAVHHRLEHPTGVTAITYRPDGRIIATGERGVALWDADTGRLVQRLGQGLVRELAFDSAGALVATAGSDATARIWDCRRGEELVRAVHLHPVHTVALSPDGNLLATGASDHAFDQGLQEGGPPMPFHGHGNAVTVWEARGGGGTRTYPCRGELLACDGTTADLRLATGTAGGLDLWAGLDRAPVPVAITGWIRCVELGPDRTQVAIGTLDGTGAIVDAASGQWQSRLAEVGTARILGLSWSADGARVAGILQDGAVRVWDAGSGHVQHRRELDGARLTGVRFHPDGRRIIVAGNHGVTVWELATGRCQSVPAAATGASLLRLDPAGLLLAVATGARVLLCDLDDIQVVGQLEHEWNLLALRFSPDGRQLATGSEDRTARLWDVRDPGAPREQARLHHDDHVDRLAFSHDGQHVATASHDRNARVWTLAGEELARMPHLGVIEGLAFAADDRRLITACARQVRTWWWQPSDLLADAATRVTRNLTPSEWRRFLPGQDYRLTFPDLVVTPVLATVTGTAPAPDPPTSAR